MRLEMATRLEMAIPTAVETLDTLLLPPCFCISEGGEPSIDGGGGACFGSGGGVGVGVMVAIVDALDLIDYFLTPTLRLFTGSWALDALPPLRTPVFFPAMVLTPAPL
jgi:hypothetical protein